MQLVAEVKTATADRAGEVALAPVVDAFAVVAVLAGGCADLVLALEFDEADRTGLGFIRRGGREVLFLVGEEVGDRGTFTGYVERYGHEDVKMMQIVLPAGSGVLLGIDPLLAPHGAGEAVQVEGFQADGFDVEGVHGVLLLEVGDEGGEDDQQHEGGEEDDEGAVVGGLQVDLVAHRQSDLLDLQGILLGTQLDQLLLVVEVGVQVLVRLIGLHHLQPHHYPAEAFVLPPLHADVMR